MNEHHDHQEHLHHRHDNPLLLFKDHHHHRLPSSPAINVKAAVIAETTAATTTALPLLYLESSSSSLISEICSSNSSNVFATNHCHCLPFRSPSRSCCCCCHPRCCFLSSSHSDPFVTLPSLHLFSLTFSPSSILVRPHLSPSLPQPLSITSRLTQHNVCYLFILPHSTMPSQSVSQSV